MVEQSHDFHCESLSSTGTGTQKLSSSTVDTAMRYSLPLYRDETGHLVRSALALGAYLNALTAFLQTLFDSVHNKTYARRVREAHTLTARHSAAIRRRRSCISGVAR